MSSPSIQDLARACEASYNKDKVPPGYERKHDLCKGEICVFKNISSGFYIVAHRGTDLQGDSAGKDVKADLKILTGNANDDAMTTRRTKDTETIYRAIREIDPTADIYLTGHSLGGHTASRALSNNQYVRENTKHLDTFNAGASPLQNKPVAKSSKYYYDILDKSLHHRIIGDAISANFTSSMIGKFKTYKTNAKPSIAQTVFRIARPYIDVSPVGNLAYFAADKLANTLQSHSLSNFIKPNKSIK